MKPTSGRKESDSIEQMLKDSQIAGLCFVRGSALDAVDIRKPHRPIANRRYRVQIAYKLLIGGVRARGIVKRKKSMAVGGLAAI